jgi:hypothetical protein
MATNLVEIFCEARSASIAHKNKKRITAVTHSSPYLSSYGYPNNVPGEQKIPGSKSVEDKNALIPF